MLEFKSTGANMTVYIEYVIIDNFIIDYLLLKTSLALSGANTQRARLLFCAVLGVGFSLLLPIISVHTIILTLVKVCFGLIMVLLSAPFRSKREFYITTLLFFCLTFLTGGAVIGVFSIFGIDYSSEIVVSTMFVPVYFIIKATSSVIKYLYRRKSVQALIYETHVTVFNKTVSCRGFLDTGNGLYDGDRPVIICSKKFAKNLINLSAGGVKLKRLTVGTVNGQRQNIAFEIDEVKIYNLDKVNIFNNVTMCVVKESVGDGYDVILHPALVKGDYDEKPKVEVKEVS